MFYCQIVSVASNTLDAYIANENVTRQVMQTAAEGNKQEVNRLAFTMAMLLNQQNHNTKTGRLHDVFGLLVKALRWIRCLLDKA